MNLTKSISILHETRRKAFHLSTFGIVLLDYLVPHNFVRYLIFCVTVIFVFIDYFNLNVRFGKKFAILRFFNSISRKSERKIFSISGGSYFLISFLVLCLGFSREVIFLTMSVLVFADASAAIFGKAIHSPKIIQGKTVAGSLAFLITTVVVLYFFSQAIKFNMSTPKIVIASLCITLVEIFSKKMQINDNMSIPVFGAFTLFVLSL